MDSFNANYHFNKFDLGVYHPAANLALVISGTYNCYSLSHTRYTVDALRIEQIGENEGKSMQAGAAIAVWVGGLDIN